MPKGIRLSFREKQRRETEKKVEQVRRLRERRHITFAGCDRRQHRTSSPALRPLLAGFSMSPISRFLSQQPDAADALNGTRRFLICNASCSAPGV